MLERDDALADRRKVQIQVRERPLQTQILDLLVCGSVPGIINAESRGIRGPDVAAFLGVPRKKCDRILTTLLNRQLVVKVLESSGRTHINRYSVGPGCKRGLNTSFQTISIDKGPVSIKGHAPERPCARRGRTEHIVGIHHHLESTMSHASAAASGSRIDLTFERRVARLLELVEKHGTATPLDLMRTAATDASLCNHGTVMDRKSATRLLSMAAQRYANIGASLTGRGAMRFIYWKPAVTEEQANAIIRNEIQQ